MFIVPLPEKKPGGVIPPGIAKRQFFQLCCLEAIAYTKIAVIG